MTYYRKALRVNLIDTLKLKGSKGSIMQPSSICMYGIVYIYIYTRIMLLTHVYRCRCLQMQEQAEKHSCEASVKYFFSQWHVQLLERRALKFRRVLLLSRYFHLWNTHQKSIHHSILSAESFYIKVSKISDCYIRVFTSGECQLNLRV